MILRINDQNFNLEFDQKDLSIKTPILFLHGFTGNLNDWKFVSGKLNSSFTNIFIDLIGHGNSSSPHEVELYSSESQVKFLKLILEKLNLEKVVLVGYSMGGRLAIDFSYNYSQCVKGLVLENSSFGLQTESERHERMINDINLAEQIENSTIEEFINYWQNIPLFDSQKKMPKEILREVKTEKIKKNNKIGLKNSLLGFSTGKMKNYFNLISKFNFPILLISGEFDKKFSEIAERVNPLLRNSDLYVVKNAGHNIHLEKPEEFLKLLNTFLLKLES